MYDRAVGASKPRRSPRPQDRQRDPERTRRLIVDAAINEFAAYGFAGARISAIARRAGVNQQLISYYFGGKEGLYRAISERWLARVAELIKPGMTLSEQMRHYALEALNNPEGVRLLAWSGLEYAGPDTDPDLIPRAQRLRSSVDEVRSLQEAGRLPATLDPECLIIMLIAAAMATITLPHVIAGLCGVDAASPSFLEHYADQIGVFSRHLGVDAFGQ